MIENQIFHLLSWDNFLKVFNQKVLKNCPMTFNNFLKVMGQFFGVSDRAVLVRKLEGQNFKIKER